MKRYSSIALLVIALLYWVVCLLLAHRTVTGPLNTNERLHAVSETHGTPSLAVRWGYPRLRQANFFTTGLDKITEADLSAIKIKVESPLGKTVPATFTLRINHDRESIRADFNPPVNTGETLGLTLVGPPAIPWKYQAASGNPRVIRTDGGDCLAAFLVPSRMKVWLLCLALYGGVLVLFILWTCLKSPYLVPLIFFSATGFMLVVSAHSMETRIWLWWGEFWPDGYMQQALSLSRWLSGENSYTETGITSYRNGQAWVVPMLLALLLKTGLDEASAYFLLNIVAILSALALVAAWLWKKSTGTLPAAVFLILAASSIPVVRVATTLTSDAAALFALALFVVTFARFVASPQNWISSLAVALSIAFACQIRVAMIPLICVPVAAGLYLLLRSHFDRSLNRLIWARAALLTLPALIGACLILISWKALGVLETFQQAREFARMPEFISAFRWSDYLLKSLVAVYPWFVMGMVVRERFKLPTLRIRKPTIEEMSLIAAVIGFLALLAIGKIIPWYRYWAPAALLCACLAALISGGQPIWRIQSRATFCFLLNGCLMYMDGIL